MRKLLNTLYVTSENSYLALDGENLVVYDEKKELGRLPLHNLDGIVSFGYRGTSPALMGACAERNISLCYLTPQGKFLARVTGKVQGNVLLREQQYKSSKDDEISLTIAKNCIMGKVYNARWVLERAIRDHGMQIDVEGVKKAHCRRQNLKCCIPDNIKYSSSLYAIKSSFSSQLNLESFPRESELYNPDIFLDIQFLLFFLLRLHQKAYMPDNPPVPCCA